MTTSHRRETRCIVSTLRPVDCPQPPSLVRSSGLDTLACAGVDLHAMLVRKNGVIEHVFLVITINFRPVTNPRLSRAV